MGISLIISAGGIAVLGFGSLLLWKTTVNGTNPRNGSFGIRTSETKKSDKAWDAGHCAVAPLLRAFGYVDIAIALLLVVMGLAVPALTPAVALTAICVAYIVVVGGFLYCAARANAVAKKVNADPLNGV